MMGPVSCFNLCCTVVNSNSACSSKGLCFSTEPAFSLASVATVDDEVVAFAFICSKLLSVFMSLRLLLSSGNSNTDPVPVKNE